MEEWVVFFENFDLQMVTSENQNLSVFYSDKPNQKPLEIVSNCYAESFRDIDSSFIFFSTNIISRALEGNAIVK